MLSSFNSRLASLIGHGPIQVCDCDCACACDVIVMMVFFVFVVFSCVVWGFIVLPLPHLFAISYVVGDLTKLASLLAGRSFHMVGLSFLLWRFLKMVRFHCQKISTCFSFEIAMYCDACCNVTDCGRNPLPSTRCCCCSTFMRPRCRVDITHVLIVLCRCWSASVAACRCCRAVAVVQTSLSCWNGRFVHRGRLWLGNQRYHPARFASVAAPEWAVQWVSCCFLLVFWNAFCLVRASLVAVFCGSVSTYVAKCCAWMSWCVVFWTCSVTRSLRHTTSELVCGCGSGSGVFRSLFFGRVLFFRRLGTHFMGLAFVSHPVLSASSCIFSNLMEVVWIKTKGSCEQRVQSRWTTTSGASCSGCWRIVDCRCANVGAVVAEMDVACCVPVLCYLCLCCHPSSLLFEAVFLLEHSKTDREIDSALSTVMRVHQNLAKLTKQPP